MSESIVLARRPSIRHYRAVGFISKAERRKEIEPVLLRAGEKDNGTSAADVAEHLLFASSRKVIAERLLRIGKTLGLLEDNDGRYTLTERGERAIANREVFVPEYGTWSIWVSGEPLLPSPVLRVDAADEPDAFTENRQIRDGEKERSFHELPEEIREILGKEMTPPASDGVAVRIDELGKKIEAVGASDSLTLIWKVQERQLRLQGELGGEKVDSEMEAPGRELYEIWDALLAGEHLSNDWDTRRSALRIAFQETTESERTNMSRDVLFPAPSVPGFGEFDPVTVEGVDIAARSYDEACDWATWRLLERVRDYATSERYDEWWREAAGPFAEYDPERPSRSRLARAVRNAAAGAPTTRAWHLTAAEDWGL